jgi:hypothetical protein
MFLSISTFRPSEKFAGFSDGLLWRTGAAQKKIASLPYRLSAFSETSSPHDVGGDGFAAAV